MPKKETKDEGKDQAKGLKKLTDDTSPGITETWRGTIFSLVIESDCFKWHISVYVEMKEASKEPGLDITGEKKGRALVNLECN